MTKQLKTDYTRFIDLDKEGRHRLHLAIQGMHCAGCAFKIEKSLNTDRNVEARVNVTEKRLTLVWRGTPEEGNDLLDGTSRLGFTFSPLRDHKNDTEEKQLMRYIAIAGFASGNLMIFSLALWFSPRETMGGSTRDLMYWYSALISLPTVIYAGQPFFRSAWQALKNRHTNMDVPISVAVILATAMSLFETIRGGHHVYFDSAVMLILLLLVGRYLDTKARAQARDAASDLLSLMSGTATVIENGNTRRIPAADITPGMTLLVAKGEKIMADGTANTVSSVDASALSGETMPQDIPAGESLYAGMINLGHAFNILTTSSQNNSLMGDIIALMKKAEQDNAAYIRAADRIAGWYTPVVHILAGLTFAGWYFLGHVAWQVSLLYAVTVLIITCPCALGLAVPVAQVVASSRLFKHGMLLKSADALERLEKVDTIIFDKTGTLTSGRIIFENPDDFSADDLLIISWLAQHSRHPLSQAVIQAGVALPMTVHETEGRGVEAIIKGTMYRLGSGLFCNADQSPNDDKMEMWFKSGESCARRLIFSDQPHADAFAAITKLKKSYTVIMLSGDRLPVAQSIAATLAIEHFYAGVNPKEKFDLIEREQKNGKHILMVGDGLNDAAALSSAFVSMSPSTAIDITQNAADIVYQRRGLSSVVIALDVAEKTQRTVRQNFGMALGYNIIAIPLAMTGYVTPLVAAVAMSLSSLAVVSNALRLKRGNTWIS